MDIPSKGITEFYFTILTTTIIRKRLTIIIMISILSREGEKERERDVAKKIKIIKKQWVTA